MAPFDAAPPSEQQMLEAMAPQTGRGGGVDHQVLLFPSPNSHGRTRKRATLRLADPDQPVARLSGLAGPSGGRRPTERVHVYSPDHWLPGARICEAQPVHQGRRCRLSLRTRGSTQQRRWGRPFRRPSRPRAPRVSRGSGVKPREAASRACRSAGGSATCAKSHRGDLTGNFRIDPPSACPVCAVAGNFPRSWYAKPAQLPR